MEYERYMLGEFIECYKRNRSLWDVKLDGYQNKKDKERGYQELLDTLKIVKKEAKIEDVKKKINTLRCSYRRQLKKVRKLEAIGGGGTYQPSLWWYDSMSFLQHIEKRGEGPPTNKFMQKTEKDCVNDGILNSMESSQLDLPPEDNKLPLFDEYSTKTQDTYDYLTKTWANKLRKLSETQRLFAEKAINDILFEAEMGTLTRNAVRINDPCAAYSTMGTIPAPSPSTISSGLMIPVTMPSTSASMLRPNEHHVHKHDLHDM